jgi:hypothetical protein
VVIGPLLEARVWARARNIRYETILVISRNDDTFRLRGLGGADLIIVRLVPCHPYVEQVLAPLLADGATECPADWWPGGVDPDEPRLRLQSRRRRDGAA